MENSIEELIENKNLFEWKETLAYSITYSEDNGKSYADKLAQQLLNKAHDVNSAIISFLIAHNFDQTLYLWQQKYKQSLVKSQGRIKYFNLQKLFQKSLVFKTSIKHYDNSEIMNQILLYFYFFPI